MSTVELRCESVGFTYSKRSRPVLRGATVAVREGELWALLGPNGAGKSTLLRVMAGLLRPTEGVVTLDGQPIGARSMRERARSIAWVAQEPSTPEGVTVREYVAMGRAPYTRWYGALGPVDHDAVRSALAWADIEHIAERDLREVSGGERRRAALARAHAQHARLLLFDEPTAFLDPRQQWWVTEAISKLARADGRAAVMVVHDPAIALRYATHAALLSDGAIVAQGPATSVLTEGALERVFGVEVKVGREGETGVPFVVTVQASRAGA
jgi:iron complex transport system ATP-binding protein